MSNARIKLVHLTSSLKIGGAERVLYDLVTHLDAKQFEHYVIYFHEGPYVHVLRSTGIPVYQISGLLFRYDPIFFWRLYKLIKQLKPDCLHTLLWSANGAGRIIAHMLGIRCVSVLHNNVDQDGWVRNLIDVCTLAYADHLVAVSDQVKRSVLQQHTWLPAQRVQVIPNGVDPALIQHQAKRAHKTRGELGLSDEHFVIGCVGRFVPVKQYPLLLHSFVQVLQAHPHVRLVLIGTGPQEQELRDYAHKLGVSEQVRFVVGKQAYGYYPLFDCFVQSSGKEGISMALLEAMSCGLPCVVTHEGTDHPVLSSYHNGIVVQAGDSVQLARAIGQVIEDRQLRAQLGVCAYQTVCESFHVDCVIAAYKIVFTLPSKSSF